jgi:hypothetical protein
MPPLPQQSQYKTTLLGREASIPEPPRYRRPGTGFLHQTDNVVLEMVDSRQKICVPTQGHITLGRADQTAGWQPTVDLTPYGAKEMGVSRMHADLYFENDQAFVLELGSSNGTRVNGKTVLMGAAQHLRDGDEIALGGMAMHIFFQDAA